jgi:hypothetical protein
MRYPVFGVVAPSTDVTVFNDDGITPATIYAAATGGTALAGGVVTSDSHGKVIFFADDGDYPFPSYFDISVGGAIIPGAWAAFTSVALSGE